VGTAAGGRQQQQQQQQQKERPQDTFTCLKNLKDKRGVPYWVWLEPRLVKERDASGKEVQMCRLRCIRGVGVCGKMLAIANPSGTAQEHTLSTCDQLCT